MAAALRAVSKPAHAVPVAKVVEFTPIDYKDLPMMALFLSMASLRMNADWSLASISGTKCLTKAGVEQLAREFASVAKKMK